VQAIARAGRAATRSLKDIMNDERELGVRSRMREKLSVPVPFDSWVHL
jgi:hypothetical protein